MKTFILALSVAAAAQDAPVPAPSASTAPAAAGAPAAAPAPSPTPAAQPAPPAPVVQAKPIVPSPAPARLTPSFAQVEIKAKVAPTPRPPVQAPKPSAAPAAVGRVGDGLIRFGQDISLAAGQAVSGPVIAVGGSVSVDGPIDGPVIAVGGAARVGPRAEVNGPVIAFGGGTNVDPAARVNGPVLDLPGARALSRAISPMATVAASLAALAFLGKVLAGIGWLVSGLVLWVLFPEPLRRTRATLEREAPACLVWGLFAWPALGLIGVAFAVSVVGLPLAALVALLTGAAYVWGTVALAYWLGARAGEGRWESSLFSILLGLLVIKGLGFIPVVRWLVFAAVAVAAVGASFASRFGILGPGLITPAVPK